MVMPSDKLAIFWFRQDLRISDNPALTKSLSFDKVLPIYILDDINNETVIDTVREQVKVLCATLPVYS